MDVLDQDTGRWERAMIEEIEGGYVVKRWERFPQHSGERVRYLISQITM